MKNHALAVFHRAPENLNCAQAVIAAHQAVTGRQGTSVADFQLLGGGRAPDGECGALYAACQMAPEAATRLRADFAARAGATRCRPLKREVRFPCADCVGLAAELLASSTASTPPASPLPSAP
jgi:hypothetical protein